MKPQLEEGYCQVSKLLATAGSVLAVSWIAKTFIQRKRFDRKVKSRQERIRTDKFLLEERLMSEGQKFIFGTRGIFFIFQYFLTNSRQLETKYLPKF